ncbi:MAG: peptidylprolyl isomerase [Oscillospiraceae bacterium]|nr:peptidylprolyl isomerase [Oscillospiraceae bacterium]
MKRSAVNNMVIYTAAIMIVLVFFLVGCGGSAQIPAVLADVATEVQATTTTQVEQSTAPDVTEEQPTAVSTSGEAPSSASEVLDTADEDVVFATLMAEDVIEDFTVGEFRYFTSVVANAILDEAGIISGSEEEEAYWDSLIDGQTPARDYALNYAVNELKKFKILDVLARENGTFLTENDLLEIEATHLTQIGFFESDEDFAKAINTTYGISVDLFKKIYIQAMLHEKYFNESIEAVEIDEEDVKMDYDLYKDYFEDATVTHVLFRYEGGSGNRSREDSKALAEGVLARVRAGEDIKALAMEYSEDPSVVEDGGEYTFNRYADLVPEFINWSFEAKIGQSDIVESEYGYHVMKLEKKVQMPYEEVKDMMLQQMKEVQFDNTLSLRMDDPRFEVYIDDTVIDIPEIPVEYCPECGQYH